MPVVKPTTKLPGTDPTFHQFRKYMTPVIYRGKEILGYVASCKHSGCRYTATFAGNTARDLGMWKHRSEQVVQARIDFFARKITNPQGIEEALLNTADKHSHTYETWCQAIETLWGEYTDRSVEDMPDYKGEVDYQMGVSAREAARKLIAEEYTA